MASEQLILTLLYRYMSYRFDTDIYQWSVFILLLNLFSDFSFLKLPGRKSRIFGASEERLSLPKYSEFVFIRLSFDWLVRSQFLTLKENNSFNISGEIFSFVLNTSVARTLSFSCWMLKVLFHESYLSCAPFFHYERFKLESNTKIVIL